MKWKWQNKIQHNVKVKFKTYQMYNNSNNNTNNEAYRIEIIPQNIYLKETDKYGNLHLKSSFPKRYKSVWIVFIKMTFFYLDPYI